jgi:hypothetical protein
MGNLFPIEHRRRKVLSRNIELTEEREEGVVIDRENENEGKTLNKMKSKIRLRKI